MYIAIVSWHYDHISVSQQEQLEKELRVTSPFFLSFVKLIVITFQGEFIKLKHNISTISTVELCRLNDAILLEITSR